MTPKELEEAFNADYPYLVTIANDVKLTSVDEQPKDILHEAYLRVRPKPEKIADRDHFRRLMRRVMRFVRTDAFRKHAGRGKVGRRGHSNLDLLDPVCVEFFEELSWTQLQEKQLNPDLDLRPIQHVIDDLRVAGREQGAETMTLFYIAGLSIAEISEKQDRSQNAVSDSLRRARRFIQQHIPLIAG